MPRQSDFIKSVEEFPQQFKHGSKLAENFKIDDKFQYILVSGMGGSAWPAEILDTVLNAEKKDCILPVNRTYDLPPQIPAHTLAVFSSYSGNTEETLTNYQNAKEKGLSRAAVTSNGHLKELCLKDKVPFIEIPTGLVPRMATGYLFTALAKIVSEAVRGSIDKESLDKIASLSDSLKPDQFKAQGKALAEKYKDKIILIYTSDKLKALGYIWKIKLNENAKTPAFNSVLPELNHNELSIYSDADFQGLSPAVIILKDSSDRPEVQKRMDLTAQTIKSSKAPVEVIELEGGTLLEKIFSSTLLSDWLTFYLALAYKDDPLSTKLQEDFKKKLKQ